jgi:hypothetical protein
MNGTPVGKCGAGVRAVRGGFHGGAPAQRAAAPPHPAVPAPHVPWNNRIITP